MRACVPLACTDPHPLSFSSLPPLPPPPCCVQSIIDRGELVPDHMVLDALLEVVLNPEVGWQPLTWQPLTWQQLTWQQLTWQRWPGMCVCVTGMCGSLGMIPGQGLLPLLMVPQPDNTHFGFAQCPAYPATPPFHCCRPMTALGW